MYKSIDTYLLIYNVLFGSEQSIPLEKVTNEMLLLDDRYYPNFDSSGVCGAYYQKYFCDLCDLLDVRVNHHKLFFYAMDLGSEKPEIVVYHSRSDKETFIAFDLWRDAMDQVEFTRLAARYDEKHDDKVTRLINMLSADFPPLLMPCINKDSELVSSILAEREGKCIYNKLEYTIRHVY